MKNVSLVPGTRCEFVFNRLLFVLLLLPLATAAQDTLVIRLLEDSLQRERNDSLRIKYLNDISWQYHSSDIERAISYADRAGVLAHKSGNQWGIAKSYILHGVYFTIQGQYDSAIANYERCLALRRSLGDSAGVAATYHDIGSVHLFRGDYGPALDFLLRSLRLEQTYGTPQNVAEGFVNVGNVYMAMKRYDDALTNYYQYLKIITPQGDDVAMVEVLNNIGNALLVKERIKEADSSFQVAIELARTKGSLDGEAMSLSGMASVQYKRKNYTAAESLQLRAIRIWETLGNPASMAEGWNLLSELYFTNGQLRESIHAADSALALAEEIESKKQMRDAYGHLADGYAGLKMHEKAFEYLGSYVRYQDSLQDEDLNERIAEMQTRFDTERKEAENRLLQQDNRIKDLQLARSTTVRWILVGALFVGWVIAYLLYSRFKQRQQLRMREALLEEREQRTRAVVEAEEHERVRIARELHDGVGQLLAAARLNISRLESSGSHEALQTGLQLLDESAREVRSISHAMMPSALASKGLVEAVTGFVQKISKGGLHGSVDASAMEGRLTSEQEAILFRVIQELIGNILRHAKATVFSVQFVRHEHTLSILVEDDGRGMPGDMAGNAEGIGMKNVRTRVHYLGGEVYWDSQTEKGTTVNIEIPLGNG